MLAPATLLLALPSRAATLPVVTSGAAVVESHEDAQEEALVMREVGVVGAAAAAAAAAAWAAASAARARRARRRR